MANYGVVQAGGTLTAIQPGDNYFLFNNESPGAGQASVAVNMGYTDAQDPGVVFTATWASNPSALRLDIQGSNQDVEADYQTLQSITTTPGYYADKGKFAFYRGKVISITGGSGLTLLAQR